MASHQCPLVFNFCLANRLGSPILRSTNLGSGQDAALRNICWWPDQRLGCQVAGSRPGTKPGSCPPETESLFMAGPVACTSMGPCQGLVASIYFDCPTLVERLEQLLHTQFAVNDKVRRMKAILEVCWCGAFGPFNRTVCN